MRCRKETASGVSANVFTEPDTSGQRSYGLRTHRRIQTKLSAGRRDSICAGDFYICKDPYSRGGLRSEGSFQIEEPDGFAHYFLNGDVTYAPWKEENQIHSLPVTNPVGENPFHNPEDWEAFQAEAIRCSEELCPGRVSNLTFEKSYMEDGYDLYGYYFEYNTGEEILEYVDFFKFGKNNMAEVIGVREQEPNTVLVNTVCYMVASFTDYGSEPGMGWGDGAAPT